MASPVAAVPESAPDPRGEGAWVGLRLAEVGDVRPDEVPWELDRSLAALCRERGPLRAGLARIAVRLVWLRAWERIGYARLSDYATERLGLSARSVRDLAQVGSRLCALPRLEHALVSGTLGWTKVRLLSRLPQGEDEAAWIAYARRVTAEQLSREVRAVDRGSVEAGAVDEEDAKGRRFEVCCTPEVRWKWNTARSAAARAAGRMLHVSEAAELIAAEVLSALPLDDDPDGGPCDEAGVSWSQETEAAGRSEPSDTGPRSGQGTATAGGPPWRRAETARSTPRLPLPAWPPALKPHLEGLDHTDGFEIDERFRRALSMEQSLDTRIGPLLTLAWESWVHRALGYTTREAYARERLGMDPTRVRALVRLERTAALSQSFARAYKTGALSWVKAGVLAPLVSADPLGWFVEDWVAWAGRVTVRRLREDVEQALAVSETDPEAFRRGGGLPAEAGDDREIGATPREWKTPLAGAEDAREIGAAPKEQEGHLAAAGGDRGIGAPRESETSPAWMRDDREIGATRNGPEETCSVRFIGPADVVQLFQALLCTVRRRTERQTGRLPTPGEALGAMVDHVLGSWGALDGKIAVRHKVFARDGWRCAAPGCTSLQNLHDHHIRFRSAGGSDALENRITLCAFHHLRGVHAGTVRCLGQAPDGLRWEMGIRPGVAPLLSYRSGDRRVPAI